MFRRQALKKPYFPTLLAHVAIVVVMCFAAKLAPNSRHEMQSFHHRHLLATGNHCVPRSIDEFPPDFMTRHQRLQGGVIFHVVLALYLLAALAIVCDEFFVAALEKICEVTKLKPDVAGATLMAAGSSAPELFTSIVGVFFAKSDVGVSTIVGSAVFNILFIIALIGIFAGMTISLSWWPLFRDCAVYCVSIIVLIVVIQDGQVYWYESLVMLILYCLYILLMYYNELAEGWVSKWMPASLTSRPLSEHTPLVESEADLSTSKKSAEDLEMMDTKKDSVGQEEEPPEPFQPFKVPESFLSRCYWIIMLPASIIFFLFIPDCRRATFRKFYTLSFIMSIVFIAGLSYVLVWMVCIIGDTLDAPDTVMGLTFLAAGTSVPDAMASIFVARDGYGDMAVSNSVGSNIFDILLCLSLPWLASSILRPGVPVPISSEGLVYSSITLLSTVVLLVVAIAANKWRINKVLGFIFLFIYFVVIVFSCLYELNVFGGFNAQPCPRIRA